MRLYTSFIGENGDYQETQGYQRIQRACDLYFMSVFAMEERHLRDFIDSGVQYLAEELLTLAAEPVFQGLTLEEAKDCFVAMATSTSPSEYRTLALDGPLRRASESIGRVDRAESAESVDAIWQSLKKERFIDANGYPIVRLSVELADKTRGMPGDHHNARTLLQARRHQLARFEVTIDYALKFDPPHFRHDVHLDFRGYLGTAGSTDPQNLQRQDLWAHNLRVFGHFLMEAVVEDYNKKSVRDLFGPIGSATHERLSQSVSQHEDEIGILGSICQDRLRDTLRSDPENEQ